ncbi:MAG: protein kinase [Acidobacteriota bacterium]
MRTFTVGEWRVRPPLNRIERGEEARHLEPRAMDLLVYLADHAGEVLSKDRLVRAVWPEAFVTDGAVTYSITRLRQLLGDDARDPRFIETIPRRGYRLIAEVTFEKPAEEESRYVLLERLGQGGMGEVFLARDTILHRRVALKFLQPEKEKDELWLRRLMREARAAAALDHPYICKVYETGQLDGRDFIAMEYVEGEKLSRRIEQGPLPLEEALRIGLEIAEALECAHSNGIVHRDIKPSNIILTGQGHVKVTDFGIAKRFRKDEGEQEEGTLTDAAHESPGTPDYMSPEQIRGEPLDPRSDLFQFGMVLYEMLAGNHPFRRATKLETTAAILDQVPRPLGTLRTDAPERLERLVRKMLDKEPGERFSSTLEVHGELKGLLSNPAATGRVPLEANPSGAVIDEILNKAPVSLSEPKPQIPEDLTKVSDKCPEKNWNLGHGKARGLPADVDRLPERRISAEPAESHRGAVERQGEYRWSRTPWVWVPVILVVLIGVAFWWQLRDPGTSGTAPLEIIPFTTEGGAKTFPRFSPDGERIAYKWDGPARDNWDIYVKGLAAGAAPIPLTRDPAEDCAPAWSPDGRQIAFTRIYQDGSGAIFLVPSLGGPERKLIDREGVLRLDTGNLLTLASWSPDGETLIFSESKSPQGPARVVAISKDTIKRTVLTNPPEDTLGDVIPAFSPDGSQIAFVRVGSKTGLNLDVWVQPVTGGHPHRLTHFGAFWIGQLAWTSDGRSVVFVAARTRSLRQLWRVDVASGRCDPVAGPGPKVGPADVWENRLVFVEVQQYHQDIYRVPISPDQASQSELLIGSAYDDWNADVSQDGRWIAFESNRSGQNAIWRCESDGSHPMQLTHFEKYCETPRWSPDGRRIVFASNQSGNWDLWLIDPEGGVPQQLTDDPSDEKMGTWSRDGEWIYFTSSRTGRTEIFRMPSKGGEPIQLTENGGWYARESSDGRYVYYTGNSTTPGIWRVASNGVRREELVLPNNHLAGWALGTRKIYFATVVSQDYRIRCLDPDSGETTELYQKQGFLRHPGFTVSPDEEWVLFGELPQVEAELMLAENFR